MGPALFAGLQLAHALAAALWVGSAAVALMTPRSSRLGDPSGRAVQSLRGVLRASIGIFLVTGVLIAAGRLSSAPLPPTYAAVLGAKIVLALYLFHLARQVGGSAADQQTDAWNRPEGRILIVGTAVYALAIALRTIYEDSIRG